MFADSRVIDSEWRLQVPIELTESLIRKFHDQDNSAHDGFFKTLQKLKSFFYWPSMTNNVKRTIANCNICKQIKVPK